MRSNVVLDILYMAGNNCRTHIVILSVLWKMNVIECVPFPYGEGTHE